MSCRLMAKGHKVLNVDLKPLELPGVNTLIADLTDSGQAFNALTAHFGYEGFGGAARPRRRTRWCISPRSRAC